MTHGNGQAPPKFQNLTIWKESGDVRPWGHVGGLGPVQPLLGLTIRDGAKSSA